MNKAWRIILPIVIVVVAVVLWKITRNKVDPDWTELHNLDLDKIETLERSTDKLQVLFEDFQGNKLPEGVEAVHLINKPYVPIMEYQKFEKYIKALKKEKRIILSTVEGGGSTTLIDRLARFVAIDESRILNVLCTPKFDLIYHKKYIGEEINGVWKKGLLLQFWDQCVANPDQNFIAVFDDLDKLNPETLFGPDLWENFGSKKYKSLIHGKEVIFPDNFYMISSTLSAIGSRIHLHNEHFKRLGHNYFISPSTDELALYLDRVNKKLTKKQLEKGVEALSEIDKNKLAALRDSNNVAEYLYSFKKINEIIARDISKTSQLAQWSNIRKMYLPEDKEELVNTFITHVNAISSEKRFGKENLSTLEYSLGNNGLIVGSSSLASGFKVFKEWGFLTEFVVAICFALATALVGLYMNMKRKRKVTKFLTQSEEIYSRFVDRNLDTEEAITQLSDLRKEIEVNAKDNKISFPEAIFFYNSVRSKVNSIEITKNINATFLVLMDVFLDDEELSKNEYDKLIAFLHKIEHTIPKNDFLKMKEQVDKAWTDFGRS